MPDTSEAAKTAFSAEASPAERYDAQLELTQRHAPSALSDLIPRSDLVPVIDYINGNMADQEFSKSMNGTVVPFPPRNRGKPGGQSVFLDDFQLVAQGSYWDRPGVLGFDSMRSMVEATPLLNSIILTRIHQVQRFCRPQADGVGPGFAIKHVDKNVELDESQQQSVQLLQHFVTNCGWEFDPRRRKRLRRDSFAQFMAKSVRDTLTFDSAPIETEFKRDQRLGIDGFYAVDGSTIRLCTEEGYQGDDEIFALQVVQGRIRTAYTYDDLVYENRNPRTDVLACGYGLSETEMLIRVVTYLLNAMTYNGSYFDNNSIPRGIMHLAGNYTSEDLSAFKRYWNSMVKGVKNTWNVPVLVSKDQESKAQFESLNAELSEMAFAKWMTFLTSVACAIYGMSPEEIAMESFSSGKSSLSGSDTEQKIASGTDKGLRTVLAYYENTFSDFVIRPFSEHYVMRFVGLDDEDPKNRFEMRKLITTVNEARIQDGYDAMKGPIGDAPLNPSLLSVWLQMQQAEAPQDFGQPPGEGGGAEGGAEGQNGDKPDGGDGAAPAKDFGKRPQPDVAKDGAPDEQMQKALGLPAFRLEP